MTFSVIRAYSSRGDGNEVLVRYGDLEVWMPWAVALEVGVALVKVAKKQREETALAERRRKRRR